ncbi:MAG TPA: DUF1501 domain-containing protein [Acidimicrobiales bacterium]
MDEPRESADRPVAVPLTQGFGRRRFLTMAGGAAAAVAATAWVRPSLLLGGSAVDAAGVPTGNTLVQLFLRGGADGLSLVAPLGDITYQTLRPGIAVPDGAALALDGRFGLHPRAVALKALYDQGRLAVVPAAGSPAPTRSHFEAQDLMEKGTPSTNLTPDGWFGRWMTRSGSSEENALRGVGVGNGLQAALRGSSAISTPDLSSLLVNDLDTVTWTHAPGEMTRALSEMYRVTTNGALKMQGTAALAVVAELAPIVQNSALPEGWPPEFGRGLWPIARLLSAGIPVEAAAVDIGGWDFHDHMGSATDPNGEMGRHVAGLDAAIGKFFEYLGPVGDRVTVVVMSEFGRRIEANASGGTDHGRGQAMFVAGGGVSGGVKGAWPGLLDTDSGDVRVVNDYRAVLSEVLAQRMRVTDLGPVFPGFDTSSASWLGVTAPA